MYMLVFFHVYVVEYRTCPQCISVLLRIIQPCQSSLSAAQAGWYAHLIAHIFSKCWDSIAGEMAKDPPLWEVPGISWTRATPSFRLIKVTLRAVRRVKWSKLQTCFANCLVCFCCQQILATEPFESF